MQELIRNHMNKQSEGLFFSPPDVKTVLDKFHTKTPRIC